MNSIRPMSCMGATHLFDLVRIHIFH